MTDQSIVEEGRVFIKTDEQGTRWVHIESYYPNRNTPAVKVAYCREDELLGFIEALQKAQDDLIGKG